MHERLADASINAALAAIEIYNKPDFRYREQSFVVLMVNAWELLIKAKIVSDSGGEVESLYVPSQQGSGFKTSRSGNPLTIEILGALKRVPLEAAVSENIKRLVEIRDTVVHFYHDDSLSYIVFALGAACVRNFYHHVKAWFGVPLEQFNFYILPLASP